MAIRTRLALAFSVTAFFLLLVGGSAVWFIHQLNAILVDTRYYGRQLDMVADTLIGLHDDPHPSPQNLARINDLEKSARTAPEQSKIQDARTHLGPQTSVTAASAALNELATAYRKSIVAAHDNLLTLHQRAVIAIIVAMICSVLLMVIVMHLVRAWLLYPVVDLQAAAGKVANGEMSHRALVRRDDELGELAASINQMAGSLEELKQSSDKADRLAAVGESVSFVTHNLAGPLRAIRTLAQYERSAPAVTPDARAAFDHILVSVDKLERWTRQMTNGLRPLDAVRSRHAVESLVVDALRLLQPQIEQKGITVRYEFPESVPGVHVDANLVEQAFVAVFDHAVTSCPDDGQIQIHARDHSNGSVGLDVHYQTTAAARANGHNLGVTLAQKIISAHGGQLQPDGAAPLGACLRITLPTAPGPQP